MDEEMKALRSEVRLLAMWIAQTLPALFADAPHKLALLDESITRFEGLATSAGGQTIMHIVRDAHDKMASSLRTAPPSR